MNPSIEKLKKYVRAANYLSAAQIYLQDNFLLDEALTFDHIKPRLLGHWGTVPGINFVYAHLNRLIKEKKADMLFVLGPGHGFPALQANLFIEGTLKKYYPKATADLSGIAYIAKNFSWPCGFPSHSNPGAPGVILEGGELGYSLSTSYGAALDNPNLIVSCLIGDGEAETGALATSWHLNKFFDPVGNGAVLPILHLNGYKISGPTVFGRMSNTELKSLFSGYGYEPFIVEGSSDAVYETMYKTIDTVYAKIRSIQHQARKEKKSFTPRWPMIILKTPKGWTGIKTLHGEKIEGNCLAHQVVGMNTKTDPTELEAVEEWLRSYRFEELFDKKKGFCKDIKDLIPKPDLCMGQSKYVMGKTPALLSLPSPGAYEEDARIPGTSGSSSMRRAGLYLKDVFKRNARRKNFRLLSPDETYSNKLDQVFETTTRAFVWPKKDWDKDLGSDGRVMEMLSEHSLQGLMQGYILTGRHAVFASYEAFIEIVASMVDQYAKFLRVASEISWRRSVPSMNYILTSSGWRQEHNGFSHQNPGFIDNILQKHGSFIHVYFPPDGNSALAVLDHCLSSQNQINVIVAGKTQEPRWRTVKEAQQALKKGFGIWKFASDENPDIVISAAGDYLTKEALAAIDLIKQEAPEIRIRFVNILELSTLGIGTGKSKTARQDMDDCFTTDKPIIFNFHGYPDTLKRILFDYIDNPRRVSVHGYIENGSTTTPFDMQVRNKTSRYHLVQEIAQRAAETNVIPELNAKEIEQKFEKKLKDHREYIKKFGVDPDEIELWQWKR